MENKSKKLLKKSHNIHDITVHHDIIYYEVDLFHIRALVYMLCCPTFPVISYPENPKNIMTLYKIICSVAFSQLYSLYIVYNIVDAIYRDGCLYRHIAQP